MPLPTAVLPALLLSSLAHLPLYLQDGAEPISVTAGTAGSTGKKGSGGKAGKAQAGGGGAGLQLDEEWVVEHAAMVERILPGGK